MNETQDAKRAINELFDHLGIKKIIWVDDQHIKASSEEITGLCKALDRKSVM
jgi:hypothetical protein